MLKRLALPMLLAASGVDSHGYVKVPASRNYMCRTGGENQNCGAVQYEPQSVEGPDRYPISGPPDGTLAAAGSDRWTPLNEQSSTRWAKTAASAGKTDFTWWFQANHATLDWRYYITRDGWDQNAPLARSSFEGTPFCSVMGNMKNPDILTTHSCTLPSKAGYHVVLAVWDVGDTANTFYNAIDLDFRGGGGGGNPVPPVPVPPVPVPPASCSRVIPLWATCLNEQHCCAPGAKCHQVNKWFAHCRPANLTPHPPTPPPTPLPTPVPTPSPPTPVPTPSPPTPVPTPQPSTPTPPATPPPSPGSCSVVVPLWGNCLQAPSCCVTGAGCYKQSRWYAQCVKPGANYWGGERIG
eukprot:TRINITY_DN12_c0_g1_i3.p1 TRINITY_DN12_c0_g1~~TRINITY_DN12_c0_g1_i3.p1  ORF type:complete len:352 (+),score=84.41 TRINITY_DN12_c0_g1_i3:64-1119(+)